MNDAEKGVNAIRSFEYLGITFEPLRDFIAAEESFENLSRRTKDLKSVIYVAGYSHASFFKEARAAGAFFDLYTMNGSTVVTPGLRCFYKYDLTVPLLHNNQLYYSECCGKIVEPVERQQSKKAGPYVCSMCKTTVTMTGRLKNRKRRLRDGYGHCQNN